MERVKELFDTRLNRIADVVQDCSNILQRRLSAMRNGHGKV